MDLFSGDVDDVTCDRCDQVFPRPTGVPGVECPVCVEPGSRGFCKGPHCRAVVRWVRTQLGADMPLDIGVDPEGNVLLEYSLLDGAWRAQVLNEYQRSQAGPVRWRAHWATCPDADLYRDKQP